MSYIKSHLNRLNPGGSSVLKKSLLVWGLTTAYPALYAFLLGVFMAYTEDPSISFYYALTGGGLLAALVSLYTIFVWGPINSIFLCCLWFFNICNIQYVKKWLLYLEPLFFILLVGIYYSEFYYNMKTFLINKFPGIFDYDSTFNVYLDTFLSTIISWSIPILLIGLFLCMVQFLYRFSKKDVTHK